MSGDRSGISSTTSTTFGGSTHASNDAPTLSIVVPTYNRRDRLARVIQAFRDQDLDEPYEIVVVSDGSSDGTDELLERLAVEGDLTWVSQPNGGPAAARNRGVELARADLVVFVDDDVVADRHMLRTHLECHRELGNDVVVIGPMLNPADHAMPSWVEWEQAMLAKQYAAMSDNHYRAAAKHFYTGNASVRAEHVRRVGGFDTAFRRAEDIELAYRLTAAGLTFHFDTRAIGYHYAERSFAAWHDIAFTYGRNDIKFARDLNQGWLYGNIAYSLYHRHWGLRWLTNLCMVSRFSRFVVERALGTVVGSRSARLRKVESYALSGIYGVAYHGGVAKEAGRFNALRITHGWPPSWERGDRVETSSDPRPA